MGMSKITTSQFIEKARRKHSNFYDYSKSVYTGSLSKLTITCPEHGDFEQLASDHANVGKGCPQCGRSKATPARLTKEQFLNKARAVHGHTYDYDKLIYVGSKKPVIITCPQHGDFEQLAGSHLRGRGCPKCHKGRTHSKYKAKSKEQRKQEWLDCVRRKHEDLYDYSHVNYVNQTTPVDIICPKHGVFSQTPNNHKNCKCPKCAQESRKSMREKSIDEWVSDFKRVHEDRYRYENLPPDLHCKDFLEVTCPIHGKFTQQVYVHAGGFGCPRCSNKVSRPESELVNFIKTILPENEVVCNTRSVIAPYELDVWLPGSKVALEFNGTYWHSDMLKPKNYHQIKSKMCRNKGITLIHVYEHLWETRKEKYKNLITSKLNAASYRVFARKTQLKTPSDEECGDFLEASHFQGKVPSTHNLGLYDDEGLVALSSRRGE